MLVVKRIIPCAKVLRIMVMMNIGLLPYVSEYGGRMKKPMNMPTM